MSTIHQLRDTLVYTYYEAEPLEMSPPPIKNPENGLNGDVDPPQPPFPGRKHWQRANNAPERWYTLQAAHPQVSIAHETYGADIYSVSSVFWCRRGNCYWITNKDCTVGDEEDHLDWTKLKFEQVADVQNDVLWKVPGMNSDEMGSGQHQHPANPKREYGFYNFLPGSYFGGHEGSETGCELVMNTTLLLNLLAMCPTQSADIPTQIQQHFRPESFPIYRPLNENDTSRDAIPSKAIVVKTAILRDQFDQQTTIPRLTREHRRRCITEWEKGQHGPLICATTGAFRDSAVNARATGFGQQGFPPSTRNSNVQQWTSR